MSGIPFTQFLRPHGRPRPVEIERPDVVVRHAADIIAWGGRFEIEELRDGTVSMTVEHPDYEQAEEPTPVASQLCPNRPPVVPAVDQLVADAYARLQPKMGDNGAEQPMKPVSP